MNFTDLSIFLAYITSDEQFYHINPKEKLNYSDCLKYCNSLDSTLPAYNEKPLIQKFILDVKYGSKYTQDLSLRSIPIPKSKSITDGKANVKDSENADR